MTQIDAWNIGTNFKSDAYSESFYDLSNKFPRIIHNLR